MDKKQIIEILEEMALLLELSGENVFKVRAHENAARALESLTEPLEKLIESQSLTEVKGIGKGLAEKIERLYRGESLPEYEKLKAAVPEGVVEMSKIQGLGPKKIKVLWQDLGITGIDQLETAAKENRIAGLKGFGEKTQEKILQNIALMRKFSERHLLSTARKAGEKLHENLKNFPGVIRCELAGSLRRWKETVKDIDIVLSAEAPHRPDIMTHFTTLDEVEKVVNKGDTKSTIVLKNGIYADLRIVSDDEFPHLLQHLTGSKEHNVALRQHAIKQGMKMSEYGLFRGETRILCRDEAEIYATLGMAYIPPELRENTGELEAAQENRLPQLIEPGDIRGMIHNHSVWSDGHNTIAEMAQGCIERGYEYLVISDHSKAAAYANGLTEQRIREQHEEIERLNRELAPFRILKSIECDILSDGSLDYDDEILSLFDLVIVSIHSKLSMSETEATDRIIKALENPYTTILGHMTGRLLLRREGYPVNHAAVIDAAAELGVAIEINANPRRLDMDWRYCPYAKEKGVKIAIDPDAHQVSGFDDMAYGIGIARKGWLTKADVLNCLSADELLKFAQKRRQN
jgi:DNA polymerase (family 10)